MLAKRVTTGLAYLLILAIGLGLGMAIPRLVQAFKPAYRSGDFSAYYPDAKTNVLVYGTATCPYCIQARKHLKSRNIAFADIDVDSEKGRRDFADFGAKAVPVIVVGDRLLKGFNPHTLDAALAAAGYPSRP